MGKRRQPPCGCCVGGCVAVTLGFVLLCAAGVWWMRQPPPTSAAASQPFDLAALPKYDSAVEIDRSQVLPGVVAQTLELTHSSGSAPGTCQVIAYRATAPRRKASVPCVLVAPAGSDLVSGMVLSDGDVPEHLPYARAGFVVIAYDLAGWVADPADGAALRQGMTAFMASSAGLANARWALNYAVGHFPEIDPKRIFAAGHSSAATHSLLLAAHEPKLAASLAFAPCPDIRTHLPAPALKMLSAGVPGLGDFVVRASPVTHIARLRKPVFLFCADDDSVVPPAQVRDFAARLKAQGTPVKLETVATGDHYDSMIEEGLPRAIAWMKKNWPG